MRFFYATLGASIGVLLTACPGEPIDNGDGTGTDVTVKDVSPDVTGTIVINEVSVAGAGEDWIELFNKGESTVDLGGWIVTDSDPEHRYIVPDNTPLDAGSFLVIARSPTAGFDFGLGNTDEVILYNSEGEKKHSVAWTDGDAPAGTSFGFLPDGEGEPQTLYEPTPGAPNASLAPSCGNGLIEFGERCDTSNFGGDSCTNQGYKSGEFACIEACTEVDKSDCEFYPSDVVINEVSSSEGDPIELLNTSNEDVDLTGWVIADSGGRMDKDAFMFPPGTTIKAGEYLVLEKAKDFDFGLGVDDAVLFYSVQGLVEIVDWQADEAVTSYCRQPDATGEFQSCDEATLGESNTP